MKKVVLATLGLAVLGSGIWLGRSSSRAKVTDVDRDVVAEPIERAPVRRARAPELPTLRPRAVSGLAADLVAADPKIRLAAVREVARAGDDPQTLLVASRDPDPSIAGASIAALGKLYADGQVSTADMLARASDRTGGPRIHAMALNAVGTVAHPDTAKLLGELAASGSVGERRAVTALLGSQDPADAIPLLIRALSDEDDYVRDNAINGLRALSRGRDFGLDASAWQQWWQTRR